MQVDCINSTIYQLRGLIERQSYPHTNKFRTKESLCHEIHRLTPGTNSRYTLPEFLSPEWQEHIDWDKNLHAALINGDPPHLQRVLDAIPNVLFKQTLIASAIEQIFRQNDTTIKGNNIFTRVVNNENDNAVMKVLIDNLDDINVSIDGASLLYHLLSSSLRMDRFCLQRNQYLEMLLERGADLSPESNLVNEILRRLQNSPQPRRRTVQLLIDYGINLDLLTQFGHTWASSLFFLLQLDDVDLLRSAVSMFVPLCSMMMVRSC